MSSARLSGIVVKAQSGFFTIRTGEGEFVSHLRGRLKQHRQATDLIALGDRVEISPQPDGGGMIEAIAPRHNVLSRKATSGYGAKGQRRPDHDVEQVLVANVDQVVLIFACAQPAPRLGLVDRFLVTAEGAQLPVILCANKSDLVPPEAAQALFGRYVPLGYPVLYTSAVLGLGIAELRGRLQGKISVLTGPSGAGKSSLLNALQPGLGLKARTVSAATSKGRHTTVHPQLYPLDETSYVADTPGLRSLDIWDIEPEELDGYFVEMRPYVAQCAFNNCTHLHEQGCAVRQAVETGAIAASRYESYCRLRTGGDQV